MTSNTDVPPFIGYVETTVNALRLIHAARHGVIPRITRRLNDTERRTMIKSGAVFVFGVEESGIKRWTDGLLWSPSRIVGNFLVYREINERTSSRGSHKKSYPSDDPSSRTLTSRKTSPEQGAAGYKSHSPTSHVVDPGTFKTGGLIKKTITVTIDGSDLHLISYYTSEDIRSGRLKRPTSRPDIMALYMPPHIFRFTNFRVPPKTEIGPDGKPRLVCEAEDQEPVECKVEDQTYHASDPSTWQSTSPVDNAFAESSLYPLSQLNTSGSSGSSNFYPRDGDKWSAPLESVRMASRQWPPSPSISPTHTSATRRREGSMSSQTDTWPSLQTHSGRWRGESYETTPSGAGLYLDRHRPVTRTSTLYENSTSTPNRREEGVLPGFNTQYSGHSREASSQRLPWLTQEAPVNDVHRESRTPHSEPSFVPSPNLHYSAQGYHSGTHSYGSGWSSHAVSPVDTQPLASRHALHYGPSYAAGSGMSSPEDYSNVEEFVDS